MITSLNNPFFCTIAVDVDFIERFCQRTFNISPSIEKLIGAINTETGDSMYMYKITITQHIKTTWWSWLLI